MRVKTATRIVLGVIVVAVMTMLSAAAAGGGTAPHSGYVMLGIDGHVYAFGLPYDGSSPSYRHYNGPPHFNMALGPPSFPAEQILAVPHVRGYYVLTELGIQNFGEVPFLGLNPIPNNFLQPGDTARLAWDAHDGKPWFITSRGRVFAFPGAHAYGDLTGKHLTGPIIDAIGTPSGKGYYLLGTDGGVFTFGDAHFFGSMGGRHLNKPIEGLVPSADGRGYWMVASDGGVFAFGDARFRGSMGGAHLNSPIIGMIAYGNGYLMVSADGGIFDFSNLPFAGSLGGQPPYWPIVSVASPDTP